MAIRSSLYFIFNGEKSTDYGIMNVSVQSGLYEEPFLANRSILTQKVRHNPKPYFYGFTYEPLKFTLSFAFSDTWNDDLIRQTARWLTVDYFCPLIFSDNSDRIFYCLPVDDFSLVHNGLSQGYLNLTMYCNSPYSYSPIYQQYYDFSSNTSNGTIFNFTNYGDLDLYPTLEITKVGDGDISIFNLTNGNTEFKIANLKDGEVVTVDNENENIDSSLPNVYHYDDHNGVWLQLVYGNNTLNITGNCTINMTYEYKILQG